MKNGMMAAVAAAAGLGETQAESLTVDAKFIAANFPDVAKELREEGAQAEHDRIAAIEAANMPGHDAIIAAHKADRSKSGADAAMAVIAAERSKLAAMNASFEEDEKRLAGLKSGATAPAAETQSGNPVMAAREISARAQAYVSEQAAKGITVSVAEAVAHVSK